MRLFSLIALLGCGLTFAGCDSVFGGKGDPTTDEIFDAGRSEPTLINEVEYVPLFPFFQLAGDGAALDGPTDVYVGYDEFIYITDSRGLHVLDLSGRAAAHFPIAGGATSVTQDRQLRVYVTARRDTMVNNRTWSLPVVLRYDDITIGAGSLARTLWHPFDDDSRRFTSSDPIETDEMVHFTGVAVLPDGNFYVSRRGPVNRRGAVILPHNTIMEFDVDGRNIQSIVTLHPTTESLRSALFPADVTGYVHPPQRSFFGDERHFLLLQAPTLSDVNTGGVPAPAMRFSALSVRVVPTSDGVEYRPDTEMLQVASNPDRGDGFLYEEFKFSNPTDITVAADGTNYLFITDGGSDSLFVFTGQGVEGVAPPAGSSSSKPVIVSFGGTGDGATQFRTPLGVAYFRRVVYVADSGNNRISRFRLNTDFE